MTPKIVNDLFLEAPDTGATFYSPSLSTGGLNGAMIEVLGTRCDHLGHEPEEPGRPHRGAGGQ